MIVDSSALLAVILDEADGETYIRAMVRGRPLRMSAAEPLLFKGNDFAQTDIEPALRA